MRSYSTSSMSWMKFDTVALFCLVFLNEYDASSITNPFRANGDISKVVPDYIDRKASKVYHNSTPHDLRELPIISYNSPDPDCNVGFKLTWTSTVGSPVYSSPVVFPSGPEGRKHILLSTFHHHIEVLSHDGYKSTGWPLTFEDSTFQGSPMLYDIDGDGTNDVGVVDKNGNLFWIRIGEFGQYLEDYHIQVPKLKIKRDWAVGLDPKFTDNYVTTSMFDHKSDRDSGRQYGDASRNEENLFDKGKKSRGSEKTAATAKIKLDDLGSLQVRQITYPELGMHGGDSNAEKDSEGVLHGRRLLGDEFEAGVASDALSLEDSRVDEKSVQNLVGTEKKAASEGKDEAMFDVADAKIDIQSKENLQTKSETVTPPIIPAVIDDRKETVNEQKTERMVDVADAKIDIQSKENLQTKSETVTPPIIPAVIDDRKETVNEQKTERMVDVADAKIDIQSKENLQTKSETVIPPIIPAVIDDRKETVNEQKTERMVDVADAKIDIQSKENLQTKSETVTPPIIPAVIDDRKETVNEQKTERMVDVADAKIDIQSKENLQTKSETVIPPIIPAVIDDRKETVNEQKTERMVDVADAKIDIQSKENLQTKSETVIPPIIPAVIDDRKETVNEQKTERMVDVADAKIDIQSKENLQTKSETVTPPIIPAVIDDRKDTVNEQKTETKVVTRFDVVDAKVDTEIIRESETKDEIVIPPGEANSQEVQEETRPDMDDYVSRKGQYGPDSAYGGRKRGGRPYDDFSSYYSGGRGSEYNDSNFVFVDPHVLGSPVLVDVNNDGRVEVLVAVSYYFDKEEYSGRELDFDPSLYVAGGIACWNLESQDWSWLVHLDLTTDKTSFKALIYSTPTVADLDGDGRSEIVLGTSMGLLYLLDGDNGFVKRFFPLQFHEIQAQVAVADVVGDADLEMIVADMGGTVAVVNFGGEVLWDANLSGTLPHTPTIGDVDGDGQVDIAIVAASSDGTSHLWVLRGDTGKPLKGYPMALPSGAIASASVLLVDLHDYSKEARLKTSKMSRDKVLDPSMSPWMAHYYGYEPPPSRGRSTEKIALESIDANGTVHVTEVLTGSERKKSRLSKSHPADKPKSKGLHIVVPSFDGHIYVIEGPLQCAERIDIGEHIYSTPLITDVTGDGKLDMVVGTLSGQVHLLSSAVPTHPLNSWSSFPNGRLNGFGHATMGVSVPIEQRTALSRASFITYKFGASVKPGNTSESLKFSDFLGHRDMLVTFDIWDSRPSVTDRKYTVTFTKGTNKKSPLASAEFETPGRYTVAISLYPPEKFVLVIGLTNEHGQYFEDTVPIELGTRFYVWIKYLLLLPAALMYIPLLLMRAKPKREI